MEGGPKKRLKNLLRLNFQGPSSQLLPKRGSCWYWEWEKIYPTFTKFYLDSSGKSGPWLFILGGRQGSPVLKMGAGAGLPALSTQ